MNQMYLDTARLLTQVAPLVFVDNTFALKGGTAINLFVRELPRLSVDLALVFPDYTIPRAQALAAINKSIRETAVVYLASHNRPVHEVLFPTKRDIAQEYDGTFRGMTAEPVSIEDLLKAREQMMTELQRGLNSAERKFLVSLARNKPEWSELNIPHLAELPAIRWKLQNLS